MNNGITIIGDPYCPTQTVYTGSLKRGKRTYTFSAKVYPEGSDYGIGGGKISKLEIRKANGETLLSYDRGWAKGPSGEADRGLVAALLGAYDLGLAQ